MLQWGNTSQMGPLWTRLWLYGPPGGGKTTAAAMFPRPFYLLVHNENSEVTLRGLNIGFAKVGVPPPGSPVGHVVPVRKDIEDLLTTLLGAGQTGQLHSQFGSTLVIDNMTHLNDLVVTELSALSIGNSKPGVMDKPKWGLLRNFFMNLRDTLWALPMHVVFVSYASVHKDASNNTTGAGPQVQGQGAELLPGSCDALGYCAQDFQGRRLVHFAAQPPFPARHRYGQLSVGPFPNHELWQHIAPWLGYQ